MLLDGAPDPTLSAPSTADGTIRDATTGKRTKKAGEKAAKMGKATKKRRDERTLF